MNFILTLFKRSLNLRGCARASSHERVNIHRTRAHQFEKNVALDGLQIKQVKDAKVRVWHNGQSEQLCSNFFVE